MKKVYLMTLVMLVSFAYSFGQGKIVKGKVTDKDGLPMPGVSVLVLGTTTATATNEKGEFEITVPTTEAETGKKPQLVFSFIGSKTITVNYDADLSNIVLEDDTKALEEVVAVGYGTQEKIDITGSVSTVKAKDINFQPVTSYEQALQGRAPGVQISGADGQLGSEQRIRIRGSSSLSASNQPLIVIDGFIVTTQDQSNFTDNTTSNPMADINPNDIASIEVLKDAAAAAIYGARGSNGVILITTKRGGEGKTKFNANIATGFSEATHLREYLNKDQYIQMFKDAAANAGYTADQAGYNSAWDDYAGVGTFSDIEQNVPNTDWNKAAFRTGKMSQFDFSANGGNEKTKFFASFGYLTQDGIIIRNSLDRISGRFNLDHQVNNKIKFGVSVNQIFNNKNNVPENNQFFSPLEANSNLPIQPIKNPDGSYNTDTYYANQYLALDNMKDQSRTIRNISNIYATYDIIKGLTFRSEIGADIYFLNEYKWYGGKFPASAGTPSSGSYGTSKVINYTANNTLTYTKTFAEKHNFTALLGTSYQDYYSESSYIQGQGLPNDALQYLTSAAENTSFSMSPTAYTFLSYFGRVNYKFDNKYLLGVSVRTDGSSRFGADTRYGWFPSVSAGWILSEENFYKNSGLASVLNLFKLKASVGLTGNSEINNYAARGLYATANNGPKTGIIPSQLANNVLTWEKTTQYDIGIEYGLFKNRISGGVDFYVKNTTDLLLSLPIPATSGYSSTVRNTGKLTNRGWDIYINTNNLVGKFTWSTSFNISTYQNEITDMSGQPILPAGRNLNAAIVGQPLGVFYGVQYAGVDPQNGDALYYLANGETTNSWSAANQKANYRVLGNPNPDHYGGISNTFGYKGFDLTVFGQWSYGNDIYLGSGVFQSTAMSSGGGLDNQTVDQLNYWKKPGDITNIPRPELDINTGRNTSRYVSDGSYFRIKNITFGYTIPKALTEKIKFNTIRIYLQAQNAFTITNYQGNDPEVNYYTPGTSTTNANLTSGVDYYSAPQAKSYTVGIKLGF